MSDLRARLGDATTRLRRFADEDLWSPAIMAAAQPLSRVGLLVGRTLYLLTFSFSRERLRLRSAALTYMTLLSLVPALAVAFSVFAAFGGLKDAEGRLKALVIDYLAVGSRGSVEGYIERFVAGTHAGAIGGTGVVGLVITATGLLGNMEKAFNDIWGVKVERSFLERFVRYWPMLTLGPVAVGVSLTLTAAFESSTLVSRTVQALPLLRTTFLLVPWVMTCGGCTLLYAIIPNTRVPPRFAALGGVIAGTSFELAKSAYAIFARKAISYSAIYGSLSAIPLTVIWIFVSWMIVLIGASIAFAAQNAGTYQPAREQKPLPQRERERLATALVLRVHRHFQEGHGPMPVDALVEGTAGPPAVLRRLLGELVDRGLLAEAAGGRSRGAAFLPARTAERTSLADVIEALRDEAVPEAAPRPPDELEARAYRLLDEAEGKEMSSLGTATVASLLDPPPPGR